MSPAINPRRRRLLRYSLAASLVTATRAMARTQVPTDAQAQQAHAKGTCGTMGPGTGLRDGKGWIVSMMPGAHEFRVRGGGEAFLTVARLKSLDFDVGRPYYIVIERAPVDAVLEWKMLGSDWGPVSRFFLYPPSN